MEETYRSTVPAKAVIVHFPPVIGAPKLETLTGRAECCGLWRCELCEDPTTRGQSLYLRMETPFCGYWITGPEQVVCGHNKAAWNVSDPENYVL